MMNFLIHPLVFILFVYIYVVIGAAKCENWSSGFLTRSDINQLVQSQKRARSLKFRIYEEKGL